MGKLSPLPVSFFSFNIPLADEGDKACMHIKMSYSAFGGYNRFKELGKPPSIGCT
jgi:hypothetical protein